MRRLFSLLFLLNSLGYCDSKISALPSVSSLNSGDIIPVVTNPSTSPANFTITKSNLISTLSGGTNYWNNPSTGTFVDPFGINTSTISVLGRAEFVNGFGSSQGFIEATNFLPNGIAFEDTSGNIVAQSISSDSSGSVTKGFAIGHGYELRFYDGIGSGKFVSFRSSGTLSASHEYVLPNVGQAEGQFLGIHADSSTYWANGVTSVTGTGPINSSGGLTPAISLSQTIGQAETFTSSTTYTSVIQSTAIYVSSATVGFDAYSDSNTSTAQTINWTQSNLHYSRLTGNVTYTFIAPPHTATLTLFIDTGAGSFTATWPASVLWPGGTVPTITATANKYDIVVCKYLDITGKYLCQAAQSF